MAFFTRKKQSRKTRTVSFFKWLAGYDTHAASLSMIPRPSDLTQRSRRAKTEARYLKSLTRDELLAYWEIPKDGIPRLKRTLMFEIVGLLPVAAICGYSIGIGIMQGNITMLLAGVLVGLVVAEAAAQRHRWYKIISGHEYHTFKEYLFGKEVN